MSQTVGQKAKNKREKMNEEILVDSNNCLCLISLS